MGSTEFTKRKVESYMKHFRTMASVGIMVLSGIVGAFAGAAFNDMLGGATLFSMIAGIACIVDAINN